MNNYNRFSVNHKWNCRVFACLALWLATAAPVTALKAEVRADVIGSAKQLWVEFSYVPNEEALAGLDINIQLPATLDVSDVTLDPAQGGPWSQIRPQLSREGNRLGIKAISPLMLFSRTEEKTSVFQLHLVLNQNADINASDDVIESFEIIKSINPAGESLTNTTLVLGEITGIKGKESLLSNNSKINYRQINRTHSITFNLAQKNRVKAAVVDLKGNSLIQILNGELPGGMRKISWDGKDWQGNPVAAGIYFIQLEIGSTSYNKKVRHNP